MRLPLITCVLFGLPIGVYGQELPEDLGRVPGNALGFVHVRVEELVKSPALKMYRDLLPKAGAEAMAMLETRITPSPLAIDRVTVVVMPPGAGEREPGVAVFIHTKTPLDEKALLANLEQVVSPQKVVSYRFTRDGVLQIVGKNTLMLGSPSAPDLLAQGGKVSAAFKEGLAIAASGKKMIVAAGNTSLIPAEAIGQMPPLVQPLARAKTVVASLDLGKEVVLEVDLGFAEADHAKDAERTLGELRQIGKKFLQQGKAEMERKLADAKGVTPIYEFEKVAQIVGPVFVLGAVKRGEELLAGIPVTRDQQRINVKLNVPEEFSGYAGSAPILIGLLVPAVQKVREAATRTQGANNLKQLAIAMHVHYDANKQLPAPAICDANGKPLLSWRVAILPYIEQNDLYKQFKLDEPWDSEHNKKLLPRMPQIYLTPGSPASNQTRYCVPVGPGALFSSPQDKVKFKNITDGTSNTIMIVETANSTPWTKPDDFAFVPNGPLPPLYRHPNGFLTAFGDGSVRFLASTLPLETLRAAFTRSGGEVVDLGD